VSVALRDLSYQEASELWSHCVGVFAGAARGRKGERPLPCLLAAIGDQIKPKLEDHARAVKQQRNEAQAKRTRTRRKRD
jgi:hypothetical protein